MASDLNAAYDDWHAQFDSSVSADDPWYTLVVRYLDPDRDLSSKKVLEIGCGRGGFACWLASRSYAPAKLVAADFSETAIEKGKSLAIKNNIAAIDWELGDIQNIKHDTGTFDTVFSCETIEHVPDPALAVRELARVLKPGGRLFLTTPNYMCLLGLHRIYLVLCGRGFSEVGQPLNNFTLFPRTLHWVKKAGFKIEKTDSAGFYVPFPRRRPIDLKSFEGVTILKWFGHHSLVVATKR